MLLSQSLLVSPEGKIHKVQCKIIRGQKALILKLVSLKF